MVIEKNNRNRRGELNEYSIRFVVDFYSMSAANQVRWRLHTDLAKNLCMFAWLCDGSVDWSYQPSLAHMNDCYHGYKYQWYKAFNWTSAVHVPGLLIMIAVHQGFQPKRHVTNLPVYLFTCLSGLHSKVNRRLFKRHTYDVIDGRPIHHIAHLSTRSSMDRLSV